MKIKALIISLSALSLFSCSQREGWSVSGNIDGASGRKVALQAFNNNNWYTVDSLVVADNGSFEYQSVTPSAFPEVLRLTLDGNSIYFPVDSVDAITVESTADNFASGYRLAGSQSAVNFMRVDSIITAMGRDNSAQSDSIVKRGLTKLMLEANDPITSYYIINKRVGDKALFNPSDRYDVAVIGVAAQCFASQLPDDPRAAILRQIFMSAKAMHNPELVRQKTIEAEVKGLPADIKAYDVKGNLHSLNDIVSKGNVVILSFTNYSTEASPAYNVILADIYKQYKSSGLEIYQVAYDQDEAQWRQSAVNIPWIAVWNSPEDGATSMISYNVDVLPLTYVIDRKGDLSARVTDPTRIASEVRKLL